MTPRDTDRLESVIAEAIAQLGWVQAANAASCGKTAIYNYADESRSEMLSIDGLLALDAAVVSQTGRSPMLSWWTRQLARRTNGTERQNTCLLSALLSAGSALGSLQEAGKAAVCPDGPGGSDVTPRERKAIQAVLRALYDELDGVAECLAEGRGQEYTQIRVEGKIS